jgi:outer membrane lipoprotein-sorting protein
MRHFRPSLVLIGIVTAFAALPSPAADDLAEVFARLNKAAPAFRGFSADVRKVQHTELIHEDDVEIGKTIVRRAKPHDLQVRMDIDPPNEKRISVDGPKVETYYPKSNSIQAVLVGKASKPMMEQFLLLGWGSTSQDLQSAYNITFGGPEMVAGQKTVRLDLIPKDKDILAHIRKFELWISEEAATSGIAVQVKFYERGGDYSVASYTNMKLRSVSESEVKLNAPKDARREKPIRY